MSERVGFLVSCVQSLDVFLFLVPNDFSILWVRTCGFFMVQVAAVVSCVGSSGVHVAGVHVAM